jgi:hypothetical protein
LLRLYHQGSLLEIRSNLIETNPAARRQPYAVEFFKRYCQTFSAANQIALRTSAPESSRSSLLKLTGKTMKYAGLLAMPAGFFLSAAALVLFPAPAPRLIFVLCGLAVEAMGLSVAVRGHMEERGDRRS